MDRNEAQRLVTENSGDPERHPWTTFIVQNSRAHAVTPYTPVHGSWLNMVEIELSVLVRQCLKQRLPDIETLSREVKAWKTERNRKGASVEKAGG